RRGARRTGWGVTPDRVAGAVVVAIAHRALFERPTPARRPGLALLGRDHDDAVRRVRPIERCGRRPLHDLDVLDLLAVEVVKEPELRPAVARRRKRARVCAHAIDEDDRRIAEAERVEAANADLCR